MIALADAGVKPDDPALVAAAATGWWRGGRPSGATGASGGPTSPRADGPSSSRTTGTPTSTTPPRWCWPSPRTELAASPLGRPGDRLGARHAVPATAGGARSTSTTPRRCAASCPFCDFGELIDPPSADVTAHVVEMLAATRPPALPTRSSAGVAWLLGGPGGRRVVVRPLGRQLRLRDRSRRAWPSSPLGSRPVGPGRSAGRSLAGRAPERRRRLGRGPALLRRPGLAGRGSSTASQTGWALQGAGGGG